MLGIKHRWLPVVILLIAIILVSCLETWHRLEFGDFVSYGTHTHILKQSADIGIPGIKTMYAVDAFNYTFLPITIKGCKEPLDISPYYQVVYRYQVEKWDSRTGTWKKLVAMKPSDCPPDKIVSSPLRTGQSLRIVNWEATAATDGFRLGDSARFVAYSLFDSADDAPHQKAFTSLAFPIEEEVSDRSVNYRIKH